MMMSSQNHSEALNLSLKTSLIWVGRSAANPRMIFEETADSMKNGRSKQGVDAEPGAAVDWITAGVHSFKGFATF